MEPKRPDNDDELMRYLDALERADCYHVVRGLTSEHAQGDGSDMVTELVEFAGANGSALGPFVRKRIDRALGIGSVYEELFSAQRAGMRFAHLPHIIECYKTATELVVISEYVVGETLEALRARCGGSEEFAGRVFPAVCDAVMELHEGFDPPIVHRDLKPANVIVTDTGTSYRATLIDFGIARRYRADASADTTHFGTRLYAPPEQYGFGQTSVRSDVYALGMVLLFCLTGADAAVQPTRESLEAAGIRESLARIVLRATAFDPAERFGSARELQRAVVCAMGSEAFGLAGVPSVDRPHDPGSAPTTDEVGHEVKATNAPGDAVGDAPGDAAGDALGDASETANGAGGFASATAGAGGTPEDATAGRPSHAQPHIEPDLPPDVFSYRSPTNTSPYRRASTFLHRMADTLHRVSRTVGIVWDVLICITAVLFFCVSAVTTFEPTGDLSEKPMWFTIAINWGISLPLVMGSLFLMLDRRPLVKLVPFLGTRTRLKDALALVIYLLCAFLVLCVAMLVTGVE